MGEYYRIKGILHYDKPSKLLEVRNRLHDGGLFPPVRFGRDVSTLYIPEDLYRNLNRTLDYLVDLAADGAVVYTTDSHGDLRGGWLTPDEEESDDLREWAAERRRAYPEYDPSDSAYYLIAEGERLRELTFDESESNKMQLRFDYEAMQFGRLRKAGYSDFDPRGLQTFLAEQLSRSEACVRNLSVERQGRLSEFLD